MPLDSTVLVGALTLVGGIIGGLITYVLAPWVSWRVEQRRETRQHRRQLIAEWRAMVSEIANEIHRENDQGEYAAFHRLQRHRSYSSFDATYERYTTTGMRRIKRRLKHSWLRRKLAPIWPVFYETPPERTAVVGSGIPSRLYYMIEHIGEIERWWGLD